MKLFKRFSEKKKSSFERGFVREGDKKRSSIHEPLFIKEVTPPKDATPAKDTTTPKTPSDSTRRRRSTKTSS